jgi:hypothetical protein
VSEIIHQVIIPTLTCRRLQNQTLIQLLILYIKSLPLLPLPVS